MIKEERMNMLEILTQRLDKIIELLENKNKRCEPNIQFTKANPNADDSEMKSYEMEIFSMLDKK